MKRSKRMLAFILGWMTCCFLSASARADVDLWPLLELSKDQTIVMYPFFVHEEDFRMVFPFYYQTNHGTDKHVLWPLYKQTAGRVTRVAPFYYSADEDTFTIFPFLRQTPNYTFWLVPPIYTRHDGQFNAVYPFYAHSPEMTFVAPDYIHTHRAALATDEYQVWPFFDSVRTSNSLKRSIFPLYQKYDDATEHELWIAPFYHHARNINGEKSGQNSIFPIYFSDWNPHQKNYMIPLLFAHSSQPDGQSWWLFPFFYNNTSGEKSFGTPLTYVQTDIVSPVFRKQSMYFVLFYRQRDQVTFTDETKKSLPENEKWLEGRHDVGSTVLFPVYIHQFEHTNENDEDHFFLFPYNRTLTKTFTSRGVFPIYYASRDSAASDITKSTFNLLWPAYHREETSDRDGKLVAYNRRFLIFSESLKESGQRSFSLLGIPIHEETR